MKKNFGMFLGLTGHVINSNTILNLGLGTHYCPNDKSENLIDQYITKGKLKKRCEPQ